MVTLCASSVISTLLLMNTAAGQPTAGKFRHRGIGYHLDIDIAENLDDSWSTRARFTFEATGVGKIVSTDFPIIRRDALYDVPPSNDYVADWSDWFIEMGQFFDDIEKLFPQAKIPRADRQIWRFYTDDLRLLSAPFQGRDRAFWKVDSPLRSGIYHRYDPNYGQLNTTLTINVTDVFINVLVGNDHVIYVSIANVNGERELVPFSRVGPPQTSTTPVPMGSESLVI
ncbi:hypothetical protein FOZ62_006966 [Perkinsus olseni]|uniref:Uncharacterized protein n=1 Tax=Perkinsus olseni TaxID=32597 RepID=A0A7J6NRJ7_PEROL|nr:hypothetical protein FOZ62_006966 [Perkinsus olseni]